MKNIKIKRLLVPLLILLINCCSLLASAAPLKNEFSAFEQRVFIKKIIYALQQVKDQLKNKKSPYAQDLSKSSCCQREAYYDFIYSEATPSLSQIESTLADIPELAPDVIFELNEDNLLTITNIKTYARAMLNYYEDTAKIKWVLDVAESKKIADTELHNIYLQATRKAQKPAETLSHLKMLIDTNQANERSFIYSMDCFRDTHDLAFLNQVYGMFLEREDFTSLAPINHYLLLLLDAGFSEKASLTFDNLIINDCVNEITFIIIIRYYRSIGDFKTAGEFQRREAEYLRRYNGTLYNQAISDALEKNNFTAVRNALTEAIRQGIADEHAYIMAIIAAINARKYEECEEILAMVKRDHKLKKINPQKIRYKNRGTDALLGSIPSLVFNVIDDINDALSGQREVRVNSNPARELQSFEDGNKTPVNRCTSKLLLRRSRSIKQEMPSPISVFTNDDSSQAVSKNSLQQSSLPSLSSTEPASSTDSSANCEEAKSPKGKEKMAESNNEDIFLDPLPIESSKKNATKSDLFTDHYSVNELLELLADPSSIPSSSHYFE